MSNKMEEILGGAIESERSLPGTNIVEGRGYCYIQDNGSDDFESQFKQVIRKVNPPLAKSGGAVNEGCKVTLPNGQIFHAVSYKGDLEGWQKQIAQGAVELDLDVMYISDGKFILSDNESIPTSECFVIFD